MGARSIPEGIESAPTAVGEARDVTGLAPEPCRNISIPSRTAPSSLRNTWLGFRGIRIFSGCVRIGSRTIRISTGNVRRTL
jgi:hypothetical protein